VSHNQYILVVVDNFSRYSLLKAIPNKQASTVAMALLEVIGLFGLVPKIVRCDHGTEFTAALTQAVLKVIGSDQQLTVTDHPSSNGIVERMNQEVMKHLRCLGAEKGLSSHWTVLLPLVQRIINSTVNSTTGLSPMSILFGMYGQGSLNLVDDSQGSGNIQLVQELVESQQVLLKEAQTNQANYLDKYLKQSPISPDTLAVGQFVLAKYRGNRPPSKLAPRLRGPYEILQQTGTNRYNAKHLATEHVIDVHLEDLKPFVGDREAAYNAAVIDTQIEKEYLVEALVGHKFTRSRKNLNSIRFRIRWAGWGKRFDSWVKYEVVQDLEALDEYLSNHPQLRPIIPEHDDSGQTSEQVPTSVFEEGGVTPQRVHVHRLPDPESGPPNLESGSAPLTSGSS
jgi:hypothetical protein